MGAIIRHPRPPSRRLAKLLGGCLSLVLLGLGPTCPAQDSRQILGERPAEVERKSPDRTSASASFRRDLSAAGHSKDRDLVLESDNWTFRPTVVVRRETSQGSGTIVASLEGETLVVTAAHVIRGHGPISVELHRYNLGIENAPAAPGKWPRQVFAEQVAVDNTADVAIIRLSDLVALPYVARLESTALELPSNDELVSVGIDLGTKLSSWNTRLVESIRLALNESGTDRPFLVTARIPEHGRSGGGLFDMNGKLVGVCIGHAEVVKGKRMGIFSSVENVRDLLRRNNLVTVVDRSEARRARLARRSPPSSRRMTRPSHATVTPTEVSDSTSRQP
jgi:S1-C subfamily serine protease